MSAVWKLGQCALALISTATAALLHFLRAECRHELKRIAGYDTRCYFNVRSKADMSRLNLPHGDDN